MSSRFNLKYAAVLIFCGVYIPFEDYIVYLLPIDNDYKIFLKLGSELILYLLLAITLAAKFAVHDRLRCSPIDLLLASFIGFAVFGILINSASWIPAINNMRALLRYVAAYYIVFHNGLSLMSWRRIISCMMVVIVIAAIMSVMQYAGGSSVSPLIKMEDKIRLAYESGLSANVFTKDEKIGAVQGMFESPGTLGIFSFSVVLLLIARYASYSKSNDYKIRIAIILALILSFFTYSKTAFLLNLFVIGLFYYFYIRNSRLPLVFITMIGAIGISITYIYIANSIGFSSAMREDIGAFSNITNLFSSEYWTHFFSAERGWIISEVAPRIINSVPIIGYSPDPETAKTLIVADNINMYRLLTYPAFEDVYIVAMLAYYGFIGLTIYFIMLFVLMRCGIHVLSYARVQNNRELAALSCSFLAISLGAFIYSFFERIYEIKAFSYYYWILAGTMARIYMDINQRQINKSQMLHPNSKNH